MNQFSPQSLKLETMKRNSRSIIYSGAFSSPTTPECGGEMEKSWSSERVRRHVSAAALMPFNSGRALPSKWDDAERWITSPVSPYSASKSPIPRPLRRPKSISGPLGGPPGVMGSSPLTTGVLVPVGFSIHYEKDNGNVVKSDSLCEESNVTSMSSSVPGSSDLISETSMLSLSQDDKPHGAKEKGLVSHGVNHRDMSTQMSPDRSTYSSRGRLSFSDLPSPGPSPLHQNGNPDAKDEVRDVQVDKGITPTGESKKQGAKKTGSSHIHDTSLPLKASEASTNTSKLQREEAKITAWENLQKARAEEAVRKLEMKLEKKRSASMDKILNKFKASQMKAQTMRNLLSERDAPKARSPSRSHSSIRKYVKLRLSGNWFACRRS